MNSRLHRARMKAQKMLPSNLKPSIFLKAVMNSIVVMIVVILVFLVEGVMS